MLRALRHVGLAIVFAWFMFGGVGHFTNTPMFLHIMPPWVPFPLAVVYVSGIFEIVLALGILIPALRQRSGNALIVLTLVVTPANIHMWLYPEMFPEISPALLSVRLLIQVLLLALIWWSTRMPGIAPLDDSHA